MDNVIGGRSLIVLVAKDGYIDRDRPTTIVCSAGGQADVDTNIGILSKLKFLNFRTVIWRNAGGEKNSTGRKCDSLLPVLKNQVKLRNKFCLRC